MGLTLLTLSSGCHLSKDGFELGPERPTYGLGVHSHTTDLTANAYTSIEFVATWRRKDNVDHDALKQMVNTIAKSIGLRWSHVGS